MPRKSTTATTPQKKNIVAFKVEDELAEFLNNLPNKSDFIRKAILAQFGMTCPLCIGSGVVPRGLHEHFKPIIETNSNKPCENCRAAVPIPMSGEGLATADRSRLEQFLHGGLLYCAKCFATIPKCGDCDWHVPMERVAEHFRAVHIH